MITKKSVFTAIDLFSGCGGLTLGLKKAGFSVIGAVDIENIAVETYEKNHPEVCLLHEDIRKIRGDIFQKKLNIDLGELDLLAGCPPCQGFSSVRTLNGKNNISDDRNDLVFEFLRLVKELLPKIILMENVPALAKDSRMVKFIKQIKMLGYDCSGFPVILNAADYGVPQRRRRMIFMASRIGKIDLPKRKNDKVTVRDAIMNMPKPGHSGDYLHDLPEARSKEIMNIIRIIPKDGGSRRMLGEKYQLDCHKKCKEGFKDIYGRMKWDDVAPTITGGCISPSKGRFLHPDENRAITLREAALLQSFPKKYYFSLKKGKQGVATMIGNALPPLFIKSHAVSILSALSKNQEAN